VAKVQKSIRAGPVPPPDDRSQPSQASSPTNTSGKIMASGALRRRAARISGVSRTNHRAARMYQRPPVMFAAAVLPGWVEEREDQKTRLAT
jgi:hypothetical protein